MAIKRRRIPKTGRKRNRIDQGILWTLIGLFLVPVFVREMFIRNFYQINYFAVIGSFCILYSTLNGAKLKPRDLVPYLLIVFLAAILFFSEWHAGRSAKGFVRVFCGLILPLPLLCYRMRHPEESIKAVLGVFKIVSVVVVVMGVADIFMGRQLVAGYYEFANDSNYADMARSSLRLYSYIGHPLYNAELFLMTFGMNYAYNEIFEKDHKSDKWIALLVVVGIAMTASKSAIALILVLLVLLYVKNLRYMLFSLVVLAAGYFYGVFDMVIERFRGSLTTGRSEVWERISRSGIDFFHFFWGNGADSKYSYSYLEEWARAAFEYPYRLYALEFGILFTIIIFIFLFALPEIRVIKKRAHWKVLSIILAAVAAHVNMYNGIGTYSDPLFLYCLFVCVIINMSALGGREKALKWTIVF